MNEFSERLTTRARLTDSPSTLVSAEEARWLLGRDLTEPLDAVGGLAAWSSWLAALDAPSAASEPIRTWRAVAIVLGIDEDTLSRRRRALGDATRGRPWFGTPADAIAWWKALLERHPEPPPQDDPPSPRPKRPKTAQSEPLNARDALRALRNR